jgi:hypothetical protein
MITLKMGHFYCEVIEQGTPGLQSGHRRNGQYSQKTKHFIFFYIKLIQNS